MKTSTIVIFLAVSCMVCHQHQKKSRPNQKGLTILEKCWDETLSRHPVDESFYGIKTHYDQLEDLSDDKAMADEKVWERQLAS